MRQYSSRGACSLTGACAKKRDNTVMFSCKLCDKKKGTKKRNLKRHHLTVHQKTKTECSACGKRFCRSDYLKEHQLKCTGNKGRSEEVKPTLPGDQLESDTRVLFAGKAGDILPWSSESNILLLATTAVRGVLLPKWYPPNLAHWYLGLDKPTFTSYVAHQQPILAETRATIKQTMEEMTSHLTGESSSTSKEGEEAIVITSDEEEDDDDDLMISNLEISSDTMEEVDDMNDLEM